MATNPPPATPAAVPDYPCVEGGLWTPIPRKIPSGFLRLRLKDVDKDAAARAKETGVMTFHALGCSGNFDDLAPGAFVGKAMAAQNAAPGVFGGYSKAQESSFLFHLGDIVYKAEDKTNKAGKEQGPLYTKQLYAQYHSYEKSIFAIPGNHDSKTSVHESRSAIDCFMAHFCAAARAVSSDNQSDDRRTMNQPYPYWLLDTPLAYIIGLATNDVNGGQLDDPASEQEPQYDWLVNTLIAIRDGGKPKAIILALHYPPYSGAANFGQRGDPNLSPTPRRSGRGGLLPPLGILLQHAFIQTNVYPDVVLSAHVHSYQRITYTMASGRQIPFLICGSGGHGPIEELTKTCWGKEGKVTSQLVFPRGLSLPHEDEATLVAYDDEHYGFLRLTVDAKTKTIAGEFFAVADTKKPMNAVNVSAADSFLLDTAQHRLIKG